MMTKKMPNQIGSMPRAAREGESTGTMISIMESASRNSPISTSTRAQKRMKSAASSTLAVMKAEMSWGMR